MDTALCIANSLIVSFPGGMIPSVCPFGQHFSYLDFFSALFSPLFLIIQLHKSPVFDVVQLPIPLVFRIFFFALQFEYFLLTNGLFFDSFLSYV